MAPADCYCSFHWWSQCTKWGFHQPLTGHRRPRLRLPPQLEEHYISLNCSLSVSFYSSTSSCTTSTTVWLCVSGCRKRGRTSSFSEEAHGGDRRHRAQSLLSRYHKCSFGLSVDLTRSRIAHSTAHLYDDGFLLFPLPPWRLPLTASKVSVSFGEDIPKITGCFLCLPLPPS